MSKFRVLLTDYAWDNLDHERRILEGIDAELIVAESGDAETFTNLAETHQVDAIMTNWANVPSQVIAASNQVQIVSRLGIGLDNIDVAYCTEHGIPVTNVPDYCLTEVAEHALASLLTMARKIAFYHHETMGGTYELQAGPKMRRLEGQTLGIVGLGNIGRQLATKAQGLGMKVIGTNRSGKTDLADVEIVDLPSLLQQSDYVSLHVPLVDATKHLMSAEQFKQMKSTAYLINTARGGVVDHAALAAALEAGELAGAALDVQTPEPPNLEEAPYNDPRVIVTPHAAFVSVESLDNLRCRTAQQVADRLTGKTPENVVNGV